MLIWQKIKETDVWIGKTIFHPTVIFLCRVLNSTQYKLHRDLWFLGVIGMVCVDVFIDKVSLYWVKWLILIFFFIRAVFINPDTKTESSLIFRLFVWSMFILSIESDLISIVYDKFEIENIFLLFTNFIFLLAEYAVTIGTLPPRKNKEKKKKEVYHESLV